MRAKVTIRGIKESVRKIEALSREGAEQLVSGLLVIGETIATDVRASRPGAGVPVDEGGLRASIRVLGPSKRGILDLVQLVAGGSAVRYALRQHEELQYRHTVGEARYFVRGFERWASGGNVEDAYREMMDAAVGSVA